MNAQTRRKAAEHLWVGRIRGTVDPDRTVDAVADADEPELPWEPS